MITYAAFLRGVNMTGHNTIRMAELSDMVRKLGFSDAETYIQSGNVIFNYSGKQDEASLTSVIEAGIKERFGHNVRAMLRSLPELRSLTRKNPYLNEDKFDSARMAVLMLHEEPDENQILKVKDVDYPPDKFKISGKEIFIFCPNGFGKTKLYTNFFENKMKVTGTARNWKTMLTILEMCEKKSLEGT